MTVPTTKEETIYELRRIYAELRESSLSPSPYSEKSGQAVEMMTTVLSQMIPLFYFSMTEVEKQSYVMPMLLDPMLTSSEWFVSFVAVVQMKSCPAELVHLFEIFLKSRTTSLIEQITRISDESGMSAMIYLEHTHSVMSQLLHLPDIIANSLPKGIIHFFQRHIYSVWIIRCLFEVYFGFSDDRDNKEMKIFISKCCILDYTSSLVSTYLSFLNTIIQNRGYFCHLIQSRSRSDLLHDCSDLIDLLPDIRFKDFVSMFINDALLNCSYRLETIIIQTVLTSTRFVSLLGPILTRHIFPLKPLSSLLHHFYQYTIEHYTSYSKTHSYYLTLTLTKFFHSSSFSFISTSNQIYFTSLLYLLINLSHFYFSSDETPINSPILSSLTQAIGKRLSSDNSSLRPIVIAIAKQIAHILTPEKQYDWPDVKLTELDIIVNELLHCDDDHIIKEESNVIIPEIAQISVTKRNTDYFDPDEIVNIFDEENRITMNLALPEEVTENDIPEIGPVLSSDKDSDDEFLPYDLTESETVNDDLAFHSVDDCLDGLINNDHYRQLNAWHSFQLFVCSQHSDNMNDSFVMSRCIDTILEMNGIVGCSGFWDEFRCIISELMYANCIVVMTQLFKFLRKNGKRNLSSIKCMSLVQAIYQGANMLYRGTREQNKPENGMEKKVPIFVGVKESNIEENGMIRIAKTKYKPSYYRKQIEKKEIDKIPPKSGIHKDQSTNRYTSMSREITQPLLTWCLRFPPIDETCVACLLVTVALLFRFPVLSAIFDESFRDISALILRYRFHKSGQIRQSALELFSAFLRYDYQSITGGQTRELQEKGRIVDWLSSVVDDDPDEGCRTQAAMILSQFVD